MLLKSGARNQRSLIKKSSSQSEPLLPVLSGGYAVETPGEGLTWGEGGSPWSVITRVASTPVTWTGRREQQLVGNLLETIRSTLTHQTNRNSKIFVFRFYSFYISHLGGKNVCWHLNQ